MSLSPWVIAVALLSDLAVAFASKGPTASSTSKVIEMLESMLATAKKEKHDEEVAFSSFSTWCTEESSRVKNAIAASSESIEGLSAEIGKLGSDVTGLGESIAKVTADLNSFESDKKSATEQRAKDHADFLTEEKDYSESVDALDRAITVLMKESYDRPATAAALVQVSDHPSMPEKARSILAAFVGMSTSDDDSEAASPEANAYEFQSTGIVDLLKKLRDEFRSKLAESQKAEMNSKHAYDMVAQDRTAAIANAEKTISEQSEIKARKQSKAALSEKELGATAATKASDEKLLSEMTTECSEKKLSFGEKQELRAEEIEAIEKTISILSDPELLDKVSKHLSLAQVRKVGTALAQRSRARSTESARMEGVHRRIREFLEAEGKRLHSQRLGLLAQKMEADPFAKVKKLIDDMITRLLEEANSDADHEGFCDTEMGKSKITRNKLSEEIDALTAATEEGKATIAQLTEEIATLSKELAALEKAMTEATELRASEKASNAATVKDAQAGQAALEAAIAVLKDFYTKALKKTAFLQEEPVKMGSDYWKLLGTDEEGAKAYDKGHKEGMQTFGEKYTGQQEEAGGVMALMDVLLSDMARLEADTTSSEALAVKAFEDFTTESKKSKATKTKEVEMNTADKTKAEAQLESDTQDLKATQDALLAAERYYEKLVPQCIDKGMTFKERTDARAAEISSLKEALNILSNEDIATSAL